jgi:hypothetical protein
MRANTFLKLLILSQEIKAITKELEMKNLKDQNKKESKLESLRADFVA